MPTNTAVWIMEKQGKPFVVKEAPYPSAGKGQVVVKVGAVAINPADPKVQRAGLIIQKYPSILGNDVAGEIVEVGEGVEHLKVGQRVLGHPAVLFTQDPAQGGFQNYTIVQTTLLSPIPDSMIFAAAAVLPVAVATAAAGLYQKEYLALDHPTIPARPNGKVLIVWGGSSSVGCCAIQLGVASGYEVIATASKRNVAYVKELGASQVIDYSGEDVVGEFAKALEGKELAGIFDAISSPDTIKVEIAVASKSATGKKIATTAAGSDKLAADGVDVKSVFATTIMNNEVGPAIFQDFLPKALAAGSFQPKPEPYIVGSGLDKIQEAVDKMSGGVSASKLVVTL